MINMLPKPLKKSTLIFLIAYSISLLTIYAFPIGLTSEWYDLYKYLDEHEIMPYINVREGYPPIGFIAYMPIYHLYKGNPSAFYYCLKLVNGLALTATSITLYGIFKANAGESRALKRALTYSLLPSVVFANTYSNDIIALLPAALAIYAMIKRKPKICGALIGLAALSKGFPALLIIPALIKFECLGDKVKVAGASLLTLLYVSIPFLALNPLAYISTFTHHGSRGPWETIWALLEGYYSHGGFLHPYFDKYFYHGNIINAYPPSPYDHAFYLWRLNHLPIALTVSQAAAVVIFSITYAKNSHEAVNLCGLLYLSYMLFFKGYSTQFAVSTPLYMLLADARLTPLFFIELSHIMQILAWGNIPQLALRNMHMHLLVSSILIRTAVFAYMLTSSIRKHTADIKDALTTIRSSLKIFKHISTRRVILLIVIMVLMGLASLSSIRSYLSEKENFRSIKGIINVSRDRWANITLSGLERGDKVLMKINTNTWMETQITPKTVIERGIRNQYNLKGSFNESILFFRAEAEQHTLALKMKHPKIPFKVTDGLEGDLEISIENNETFTMKLIDEGLNGKDSLFRMAYKYEAYVGENLINLKYGINATEEAASTLMLDIFDDTDEWLYTFKITEENFTVTAETRDIEGCSNLKGDYISLIALSVIIRDKSSAIIVLKEISINNESIRLFTEDSEIISYEIYMEKNFKPSAPYIASISLLTILITYSVIHIINISEKRMRILTYHFP